MKKIAAIAAAACVMVSGSAFAAKFSPAPKDGVTITGTTSLTATDFVKLSCTATFKGKINDDGTGTVTSATFAGGPLGACSAVTLNTPFDLVATDLTHVTIKQLKVSAAFGLVQCGPADISGTFDAAASTYTIPKASINPGVCTVTAALKVPTDLKIVP